MTSRPIHRREFQLRLAHVLSRHRDVGCHEGSLLLWILPAGRWTVAVTIGASRCRGFAAPRLGVSASSASDPAVTLRTSNPFLRLDRRPRRHDLNPILQDPRWRSPAHSLYRLCGFAAFAFACAAMSKGGCQTWARGRARGRPAAWPFLTCRIALAAWVLRARLGGFWFWIGRERLLHAWLMALRWCIARRTDSAGWSELTLLLAILAFSLSMLVPSWCAPGCWCRCIRSRLIRAAAFSFWPFSSSYRGA